MSSEKKPISRQVWSLAVATVVATTTSMGCTETPVEPLVDASSAVDAAEAIADASTPVDAGSPIDASSSMDAAVAMADASFADDDADIADADYPKYIRG